MFPTLLQLAIDVAATGPKRNSRHGAVGVRTDGVIVTSINATDTLPCPPGHAEHRVCRKLNRGATVYVARVARSDGKAAMSRPCPRCMARLRTKGVCRVIYTTGTDSFAIEDLV